MNKKQKTKKIQQYDYSVDNFCTSNLWNVLRMDTKEEQRSFTASFLFSDRDLRREIRDALFRLPELSGPKARSWLADFQVSEESTRTRRRCPSLAERGIVFARTHVHGECLFL